MTLNKGVLLALLAASSLALFGCTSEPEDSELAPKAAPPMPMPSAANDATGTPTSPSGAQPDDAKADSFALAVDGEGLRLFNRATSAASPIPFGRAQQDVLTAMRRVRGPADQGTNQDCGAGPVQYAIWPDGLSLVFEDGEFAGWSLDQRARGGPGTAIGIGPGSTRAELESAYADVKAMQTTLGTEFAAGGFFGLLDGKEPNARVTYMWAGVSCVAR